VRELSPAMTRLHGDPVLRKKMGTAARASLQLGGFSEDRHIHGVEDYDLWMRMARAGASFYYLHEVLGSYRLHDESLSSGSDFVARELSLIESHFQSLDAFLPEIRRGIKRRRGGHHAAVGYRTLHRRDFASARRSVPDGIDVPPAGSCRAEVRRGRSHMVCAAGVLSCCVLRQAGSHCSSAIGCRTVESEDIERCAVVLLFVSIERRHGRTL